MSTRIRAEATLQVALLFPALLFLGAVLVGTGDRPQYELAHVAHRVVTWYAQKPWTLWCLLLALPFAAFITGCATLIGGSDGLVEQPARQSVAAILAQLSTLVVGWATLTSAGIVAIVVLHMLAS